MIAALPPAWSEPGAVGPWIIHPTATARPYIAPVVIQSESHEDDADNADTAYPPPDVDDISDAYPEPPIVEVDLPDDCTMDGGMITCEEWDAIGDGCTLDKTGIVCDCYGSGCENTNDITDPIE